MKSVFGFVAFIVRFVIFGLALAFLISLFWPDAGQYLRLHWGKAGPLSQIGGGAPPRGTPTPVSYAQAVALAAPSVVNIYANKIVTGQAVRMYNDPLMQQLFGGQFVGTYRYPEQSLGSGVIVSREGYVVTNNHVIANANAIQVLLYDGRVARARLVGADPQSDLAVLKIDADHLQPVRMADQKTLRVGDVVLAIGNPLGLNQTVTMGIISTIGRQLVRGSPEDFIQTDAAINLGNSGGALVNTVGELVGINTMMIGKSANAEGIGFAIPVDITRDVIKQLIATGHVVRGWIGANYAFVRVAVRSGLPVTAHGVKVVAVYPAGPAARAGIHRGDILLRIGTHRILNPADMRRYEASCKPGTTLEISGLRNGYPFHVEVTLVARHTKTRPHAWHHHSAMGSAS